MSTYATEGIRTLTPTRLIALVGNGVVPKEELIPQYVIPGGKNLVVNPFPKLKRDQNELLGIYKDNKYDQIILIADNWLQIPVELRSCVDKWVVDHSSIAAKEKRFRM